MDGKEARYEELYEEGSFSKQRKIEKMKKNIKIETKAKVNQEIFEIVLSHEEQQFSIASGQISTFWKINLS